LVLQQLSELGLLKEKLDTAPADERKDLSSQSHKLNQEMLAKSPQMTVSTSKMPSPSITQPEFREAKEREQIRRELELHYAAVDGEETTEAL
jgi:hypothetical protein